MYYYAIDNGVNFFDTANLYNTYASLKNAIKYKNDIIISTKAYCYDKKTAQLAIDGALKKLDRSYIDIFLLHEQESRYTIKGHWEAVEYIIKRIKKGDIRAAGISTHHAAAVNATLDINELKIIHPLYNYKGLGIVDGNADDMKKAINNSIRAGKGVYLMKVLGGGHLINNAVYAINDAMKIINISSLAIGMKSIQEIDYNIAVVNGKYPLKNTVDEIKNTKRKLTIHNWCIGCGKCVDACTSNALTISCNKAAVDDDKCILCGYCADKCKDFCIKVI